MQFRKTLIRSPLAALIILTPAMAGLSACSKHADITEAKEAPTIAGKDPMAQTTANARNAAAVKTVDEAYSAMREIRAARFAIFDGSPDAAKKLVDKAAENFGNANIEANFAARKPRSAKADEQYIPFDATMALSENFTPSEQHKARLNEANGHIAKGNYQKARETLQLANIDVITSVALVPAKLTMTHITDAAKQMAEGKYYEGNLALKAVEDSIVLDSYGVEAVPAKPAH